MKKLLVINKIRSVLLIVLFSCSLTVGLSQNVEKDNVINELRAASERYRNTKYLGFDINYRYYNEQQPGIYLDSLGGSFKLNGNNYWYELDNTEAIGNADLMIMLFKEDKIMYLTRPSAFSMSQNPVSMIDSFLTARTDVRYSISRERNTKRITLDFDSGSKYKSIRYEIDAISGYISKMTCVVRASEMYDASVKAQVEDSDVYVVVEASFRNYRQSGFNDSLFNTTKYFKKEGEEFVALPPYDSYKVFLGTNTL